MFPNIQAKFCQRLWEHNQWFLHSSPDIGLLSSADSRRIFEENEQTSRSLSEISSHKHAIIWVSCRDWISIGRIKSWHNEHFITNTGEILPLKITSKCCRELVSIKLHQSRAELKFLKQEKNLRSIYYTKTVTSTTAMNFIWHSKIAKLLLQKQVTFWIGD